jgi:hypothetical protein
MRAVGIKNLLHEVRLSVASTHSRKSTNPSHKSTKLTTLQRPTPSKAPDCTMHFRTIGQGREGESGAGAVRTATGGRRGGGMNENLLLMRRENHLNTQFNLRKNKLKEITKANKQLYRRLNTQKSFYSNSDLNKSYESTQQIRERLSQSKLSHRINSSRSSSRKSLRGDKVQVKKAPVLEIKAKNIGGMGAQEVSKFKGLFIRDLNVPRQSDKEIVKFNSYRKNNAYAAKGKASARMSVQQKEPNEAGMLHRVA